MSTESAAWQPIDAQTEPITGWRCWFVLPEEGLLRPILKRGLRWTPRTAQEALCTEHAHHAPDEDCKCGIYAVCAPLLLEEVHWDTGPPQGVKPLPGTIVVGQLALWGKVIQHQRGWRAQFAYPTHLYAFTDDAALAERLRAHYQVPVVWGAEAARLRRLLPPGPVKTAPPETCEECGHTPPPAPAAPAPHWGTTLGALACAQAWPKNVHALWEAYHANARTPYGSTAMKWADWSAPEGRLKALERQPASPTTARKRVLAKQEGYAVLHTEARCARRAVWVRLVRWRRAAIWEEWNDGTRGVRWLQETQADLARGTTRVGRTPRPYAPSTLAAMKSRVKDLTASAEKDAVTLQAAVDVWLPSYREWCALLQPTEREATEVTRPTEAPWRDWYRLVEQERDRLALERGLLTVDRARLEAERASK